MDFAGRATDGTDNLDNIGRAGTLIHEATHQLSETGDKVHQSGTRIIRPTESDDKDNGKTGCMCLTNFLRFTGIGTDAVMEIRRIPICTRLSKRSIMIVNSRMSATP